jgi:type IX secretion system PorP/SprF family membrane protein
MNTTKYKLSIALLLLLCSVKGADAQIVPLKSQFFENNVHINPANVGAKEVGQAALTYSSQWSAFDGSPKIMSGNIHTPLSKRAGVGLSIMNDKAGLISRTTVFGAYSYKVPFNDRTAIRFGLATGFLSDKIMAGDANIRNGSAEVALNNYNNKQEQLFKVGIGALFTSDKWEGQLAWHDLTRRSSSALKTVDHPGLTASVAYKLSLTDSASFVKPLLGVRQINGLSSYFDMGLNASYHDVVDFTALYHTNKTFTLGAGLNYKKDLKMVFLYSTGLPDNASITGGAFELSLLVPFRLIK